MSLTEKEKEKIEAEEGYRAQVARGIQVSSSQKYGVPAVLSLIIPGLGQLVKGQVGKGIIYFCLNLFRYLLFVVPGFILHIWVIVDAYNN